MPTTAPQRGRRPPGDPRPTDPGRHRVAAVTAVVACVVLLVIGVAAGRPNWPVYGVVLVLGGAAVVVLDRRVGLSRAAVWGLVAFGIGHAAGGMIPVGDDTLYHLWLVGRSVRYDNLQHAIGFGFVGLATWEALGHRLAPAPADRPRVAAWIVVLGAVAGGALNEIVEYLLVLTIPGTDVGGYDNTARDLIANLAGGLAVGLWTARRLRVTAGTPSPR